MMRRLTDNETAEFTPAVSVTVVFSESEHYTFRSVVKAMKTAAGNLYLELEDQSFAEINIPYRFYQIGAEIDRDES